MARRPLQRRKDVPKASFFRSMAGGVPSGATEGSSIGPDTEPVFFIFSGSFFGTPFAPKTLFFAWKNQHFEVHFGAQNGVPRGAHFSRFSLFSGSFFGTPFVPKTFLQGKIKIFRSILGPRTGSSGEPFFHVFL